MGDAAGEGHHADVRDEADEPQEHSMMVKKGAAPRLAATPFLDQLIAASGEKETVAVVDRRLQRLAAQVRRENLRRRLHGFDQGLPKLCQRERIVEQLR